MSATCAVPAAVPSVDHSSTPLPEMLAVRKTREPKRKKLPGCDDAGLAAVTALMSFTRYGDCARSASGAASVRSIESARVLISVSRGALARFDHAHLLRARLIERVARIVD